METITVGKHLCAEELKVGDEVDFFDMTCTVIEVKEKTYVMIQGSQKNELVKRNEG